MLKQQLDVLEQHSTQGPVGGSCVTLLIPAHHSAERLSAFLTQETATAQNIKDKKNGKSVVAAFAQIKS